MANYAASVLAEAKIILASRYADPEKRLKSGGALGAFIANTDSALQEANILRTKEERAVEGYFSNRMKRAVLTGRTYNHTGTVGDSTKVDFAWSTYGDKMAVSLKRHENNVMSDAEILANEFDNAFKNIYEGMDAAALAKLATAKTTVNAATKGGTFNATFDAYEITSANLQRFLQHGKSMLRQNYYKGGAEVIIDPTLYLEAEFLAAQGAGNATNRGYQFSGLHISEAVDLSDVNYALGAGYFIPQGTIAVLDWIPSKNRSGYGNFESHVGGYSSIVDPISGLEFAIHGYQERADTSAAGGDAQDVVTQWELSVDLSFNNSPLVAAGESTIFETGIVA